MNYQSLQIDVTAFNMEYRFLHLAKLDPYCCLAQVCDHFTFDELLSIWKRWMYCAICAEYSAFSEGADRKYLLYFSEWFEKIIEAEYLLASISPKDKAAQGTFPIPPKNVKYRHIKNDSEAYRCIAAFVGLYNRKQVQLYLWYMFECAISDGKHFGIHKRNLAFDYESFRSIGKAVFFMSKATEQLK